MDPSHKQEIVEPSRRPLEHDITSPARRRVGLALSVLGVAGILVGCFLRSVGPWLFVASGILIIISLVLLSRYSRIADHQKHEDIRKLYKDQQV
jgi:hypothetical protein